MECSTWKRHFHKSQFSLDHPDPSRFTRGPWHSISGSIHPAFLAYRITTSLIFLSGLIWSLQDTFDYGKWVIYLTHWGFLACNLQSFLGTYLVLQAYRKQRASSPGDSTFDLTDDQKQMPLLYKVYWVLYNIAVPVALFITTLYWSLLYPKENPANQGPFLLNFTLHGINSILCFVDLLVGGPPSRFLHFLQPVMYALVYVSFNLIYWVLGGRGARNQSYIYSLLDWENDPKLGVGIVFGSAGLIVILHSIICIISELRTKLAHKLRKNKDNNIVISTLPVTLDTGNCNKGFVP